MGWRACRRAGYGSAVVVLSSITAQAQLQVTGRAVHPAEGATDVATNTALLVEFRGGVRLDDDVALDAALSLVSEGGTRVAPSEIVSRPLSFDASGRRTAPARSSIDAGAELQTATVALEPRTHYRLQSRRVGCLDDSLDRCLSAEYETIAEFDTGSSADVTAPVVHSSGAPEAVDSCTWRVQLDATDDHTTPRALRYLPLGDASIVQDMGPEPTLQVSSTSYDPDSATTTVFVRPVDQSDNEGEPFAIQLASCKPVIRPDLGCDSGPECDEGCAVRAPGAQPGGWPSALSALALGCVMLRTRRRELAERRTKRALDAHDARWGAPRSPSDPRQRRYSLGLIRMVPSESVMVGPCL